MSDRIERVLTEAVNHFFKPTVTDEGTKLIVSHIRASLRDARIALVNLPDKLPAEDWPDGVSAYDGANEVYFALDDRVECDDFRKWDNAEDAVADAAALLAAAEELGS